MNYPADVDAMVRLAQQSGWDWEELRREVLGCWPDGPRKGGRGWTDENLAALRKRFEGRR